ncbi:MAG: addiction module antidote protein, HigA family [Deltaproteobacteria bacterium]|nr:MAG: addiction module antidote protein, HigA family [Deltaproteobacteria bacterium]
MMKRKPTHPGEFVREDILEEFSLSRKQLAELLGVSEKTVSELADQRRGLSPDMALRIGRFTKTNPKTWMNLQITWDLWEASTKKSASIRKVRPFVEPDLVGQS